MRTDVFFLLQFEMHHFGYSSLKTATATNSGSALDSVDSKAIKNCIYILISFYKPEFTPVKHFFFLSVLCGTNSMKCTQHYSNNTKI